jgi:lipid-A-disaccharide synthase-like uncharacterized protein
MSPERVATVWLAVGYLGQAFFSSRFLIQWIASERKRRNVVPVLFWWLSLGGGLCLLAYALHKRDQVFILGQSAGLIVYVRNLVLSRRSRSAPLETEAA